MRMKSKFSNIYCPNAVWVCVCIVVWEVANDAMSGANWGKVRDGLAKEFVELVRGGYDDVIVGEGCLGASKSAEAAIKFGQVLLKSFDLRELLLKGSRELHGMVAEEGSVAGLQILHYALT